MQSQSFGNRYITMRREKMQHGWQLAKRNRVCYLFLAPYAILFFTFFILPIATSIFYSFTYYNILEPARFIGFQNYINLILQDEVFLTAVKNTFVIAVITGPVPVHIHLFDQGEVVEIPLLLLGLLGEDVAVVSVLALNLSRSGKRETLFGTGVGLELCHC